MPHFNRTLSKTLNNSKVPQTENNTSLVVRHVWVSVPRLTFLWFRLRPLLIFGFVEISKAPLHHKRYCLRQTNRWGIKKHSQRHKNGITVIFPSRQSEIESETETTWFLCFAYVCYVLWWWVGVLKTRARIYIYTALMLVELCAQVSNAE